ncbi:LamG domain-containing protein, partial [Candidatus Marinimicrobia bacterium]|nr:LamG domain-containing protein [Candidatus Neomarinimicrobiota bacterium]
MKKNLNKILILFFATLSLSFAVDNYALDISSDGHVDIGNFSNYINNGQQFSVSFWFKVDSEQEMRISDRASCVSSGSNGCHRGFEFLTGAWGVSFRLIDTWASNILLVKETSSFGDSEWHHVAATYNGNSDASGVTIYIDGEVYGVSSQYNSLSGSSLNELPLRIGGNGEDSGGAGIIDEVSLWLRIISQEEIQQMMVNGLNGDEQGLLSYWNFNEGEGSVLNDISSNGFNGNIVNSVWTTDAAPLIISPNIGGNNSLSFDGIEDYTYFNSTDLNNTFSGYNPFSVSFWIYGNELAPGAIFGKGSTPNDGGNPRSVMLYNQGMLSFILYSGTSDFIAAHADLEILEADTWNNVILTYDGGTGSNSLRFYKNGYLFNNVEQQTYGSYTGVKEVSEPF